MVKKLLMLCLVVLAVGMAVPSSRAQIHANTIVRARDWIGVRLVPRRLDTMANQLDVRLGRAEGWPPDFPGWIRRDYSGPGTDPWERPWFSSTSRTSYTVGSMGPDGVRGTPDDLTVTRNLPGARR